MFSNASEADLQTWQLALDAISQHRMDLFEDLLRRRLAIENVKVIQEPEDQQSARAGALPPMVRSPENYATVVQEEASRALGRAVPLEVAREAVAAWADAWRWDALAHDWELARIPTIVSQEGKPRRWFRTWREAFVASVPALRNLCRRHPQATLIISADCSAPTLSLGGRDAFGYFECTEPRRLHLGVAPRVGEAPPAYSLWAGSLERSDKVHWRRSASRIGTEREPDMGPRDDLQLLQAGLERFLGLSLPWRDRLRRQEHRRRLQSSAEDVDTTPCVAVIAGSYVFRVPLPWWHWDDPSKAEEDREGGTLGVSRFDDSGPLPFTYVTFFYPYAEPDSRVKEARDYQGSLRPLRSTTHFTATLRPDGSNQWWPESAYVTARLDGLTNYQAKALEDLLHGGDVSVQMSEPGLGIVTIPAEAPTALG